jgi:hypothetical protein
MLQRLLVSLTLAVLGAVATTGSALAWDPSRDELAVGTFLVVLGLMFLLLVLYGLKVLFGVNRQPENLDIPDPHSGHHP